MNERKELILNTIIIEHIHTAQPVGSSAIVEKYKLDISPATVRSVMAELEDDGLIVQPHTSAGRVPTEKAYYDYISKLKENKLKEAERKYIDEALAELDEMNLKQTAKVISSITEVAVFWAFHKHHVYYTGVSNLLMQPEFSQNDLVYNISSIIDNIDETVNHIFEKLQQGQVVMIGQNNPFSPYCATIMHKYKLGERTGLFGILGPMRMDYKRNIPLMNYVAEKLLN